MATNSVILTIDAGTTSIKVALFSSTLKLLACSVQEYELETSGDFIEVSAGQYLNAVVSGIYAVLGQFPAPRIRAISVTSQGETMALFAENGSPLTPFIVWLDSRATQEAKALQKVFDKDTFYQETGLPEISPSLPLAKALWLKEHRKEEFKKAHKLLLLEDYLLYWLTGNFVTEKTVQTSTGWFSLKKDKYWRKALTAAGIRAELLPKLLESGQLAGNLAHAPATLLNLREGISVITGAMDQTAAALAAGCIEQNTITETTGTALVMTACTSNPIFNCSHRVTIYRHAINGKYLYLPMGNTAGMALKWFRDEFCADLDDDGYKAMDKLASTSKLGSGGIVFLPFLSGSVDPFNQPNAKAMFFGATLSSTRADFARSVLESVGFMLKDFINMLAPLGIEPIKILSLGGGARSAFWQQIKADICKVPFHTAQCTEAASQGAALLALWGVGIIPFGEMPALPEPIAYLPKARGAMTYEKSYMLYRKLYQAVAPLFGEVTK